CIMPASRARSCSRAPTTKEFRFRSSWPTWRAKELPNSGSNRMSANIEGEKLAQAREVVLRRMEKEDVVIAMSDAEIADPGVPDNLRFQSWLHETFVAINRTRKLDKFLEKLAEKIADGDQSDTDAATLLEIVKAARAPAAPTGSPEKTEAAPIN